MQFLDAILLGILQGATEFLPISSTGHLFLAERYLGLQEDLHFEISLHFASLLAVLIFFRKEVWDIMKGMLAVLGHNSIGEKEHGIYALKLLLATICTLPIALYLKDHVLDEAILDESMVGVTLIVTGFIILGAEIFRAKKEVHFSWGLAVLLGLVQGLAVMPGISRSGLTIAFLIWMGVQRRYAGEISFLLAIPTILGATVLTLKESGWEIPIGPYQFWGCVASFVTALLAIGFMMKWIQRHWIYFAPYCFAMGLFLWFYF